MHRKFVDVWCKNYDAKWDSEGEDAAVAYLYDNLTAKELEQVQRRFPSYVREQEKRGAYAD